ncbi:MAG: hypothetical protein U0X91_12605 [Spirosomataceae bacterium]
MKQIIFFTATVGNLFFLFFTGLPATAQSESDFAGIFTSNETGIVLSIGKKTNRFEGEFTVQNQRFLCEAVFQQGGLSGTYNDNGTKIGFTLTKMAGQYFLTTEGVNIPMKRTSNTSITAAAPAKQNPLPTTAPGSTGPRLSNILIGFSFNAPAGWQTKEENGNFAFSQPGKEVAITVTPHNYNDLNALKNDTKNVQDPASNTYLNARVEPYSNTGAWVIFNGTIKGQAYTIATIALISPNGGGVNITSLSPASLYNEILTNTLRTIANTVAFSKPQTSPLTEQWKNRLKSKELLYLNTSNGLSDKFSIDLCSNGQFFRKDDSSYSSQTFTDGFTYAGRSGNEGRWEIAARGNVPVLLLKANDGQVSQYEISVRQAGNEIGLNGRRYFVRQSQRCP